MITANSAQLGAIAEFLAGLTELTDRTGVALGGHMRPMIEVDDQYLTVNVKHDAAGNVSYALELES